MESTVEIEDVLDDINWAMFWLSTPERDLPGTLTHATCQRVLEDAREALARLESVH